MRYHYSLTTLENGIRVASVEMSHMQSVSVGFWAGIGARFESRRLSGISHFIEHLMFKGTRRRSARQIIESVEGVGGYMNAFTSEDHTCYYAKVASSHFGQLCDVLSDMYQNSRFAPDEIEREREVIREEILMYRDQPAQYAQELLSETMWPAQPLGRPLTGTVDSIAALDRRQLTTFMRENYTGRSTVVTAAGSVSHEEVLKEIAPRLRRLKQGRTPRYRRVPKDSARKSVALVTQETEQTHLAMGFHAFGRFDERRFALKLLSVILGENMSSRLFQKLREHYGFCYSVHSSIVTFADTGVISICAGLDPGKLERAISVILREIARLCRKAPSKAELQKAQDYTVGQTLMGLESTTNQMIWMGESILGYRKILDPAEVEERIRRITPEEVRQVACHCLNRARLGVAVVGPIKDRAKIEALLD